MKRSFWRKSPTRGFRLVSHRSDHRLGKLGALHCSLKRTPLEEYLLEGSETGLTRPREYGARTRVRSVRR